NFIGVCKIWVSSGEDMNRHNNRVYIKVFQNAFSLWSRRSLYKKAHFTVLSIYVWLVKILRPIAAELAGNNVCYIMGPMRM
ncbi:hypothetical protein ACJX0J_029463, partial [Zea mays]